MKVIVLGAGLVGRAIAADLSSQHQVTSVDFNEEVLERLANDYKVETLQLDFSDKQTLSNAIADFDIVVGAVPGFMGFETAKTVIETGKNYVDISFFPEDPFELNKLAQQNDVTVIVDCGVAPGLSNLVLGYHYQQMQIDDFIYYVGGLPVKREWPYQYKAPFSPIDVIEEYTRPARMVVGGKMVAKEALSDTELIEFPKAGRLEAFNSDGLRTLIDTMGINNMKEKTLRYPGHVEYMQVLRDTGFFNKELINVNGQQVSPLDLTTQLLFPKWKLGEEEPEFTVMQIKIAGKENGLRVSYCYDLYDVYDPATKTSSMARTTGYTCTAAVNMLDKGLFKRSGVYPPELVGAREACYNFILKYLEERNITFTVTKEVLD